MAAASATTTTESIVLHDKWKPDGYGFQIHHGMSTVSLPAITSSIVPSEFKVQKHIGIVTAALMAKCFSTRASYKSIAEEKVCSHIENSAHVLEELVKCAKAAGGNFVIGVQVNVVPLDEHHLIWSAMGTAIVVAK
jgi:uncharacterized protein YbjQ (UPF0145 family)